MGTKTASKTPREIRKRKEGEGDKRPKEREVD